ncbi:hypothetical protein BDN70DRAFT_867279 [Pholiota conissans]|uniref:MYND-type domain-containing protein n=1 Tax=Pholiota conissans TaxID=109636 RepID=A0A9P5YQD5_9AGAR|nr:hypothetical protein BDN70DRAFT_867279 [Pholiota conissans]
MAKASSEKLSNPLLPSDFIKSVEAEPMMKGFKSHVFTAEAHRLRLGMRNWSKPMSPNGFINLPNGARGFSESSKRTGVHFYAMEGDVLAVCELLRCGANPDQEDIDGITPVYVALSDMFNFFIPGVVVGHPDSRRPYTPVERERNLLRCRRIVQILVEQHADVNRIIDYASSLHLACAMKDWDIITLLLEHGARMTISEVFINKALTPDEKIRLSALVKLKSLPGNKARPPRVCPCWSGKTLDECHATAQPYPPSFMCICGSEKLYEKCCVRKAPVFEKWDDEHGRIVHYFGNDVPPVSDDAKRLDENRAIATSLMIRDSIDPAFAYALSRNIYQPMPYGRNFSRSIQEARQKTWNDHVDAYIREGKDKRSVFDIERAAKISVWAGALIRICEGEAFSKVEKKDIDALKSCAKCHIAVYCSRDCQRSDWSTHKRICGKSEQQPQVLPSQVSMREFRKEMVRKLKIVAKDDHLEIDVGKFEL